MQAWVFLLLVAVAAVSVVVVLLLQRTRTRSCHQLQPRHRSGLLLRLAAAAPADFPTGFGSSTEFVFNVAAYNLAGIGPNIMQEMMARSLGFLAPLKKGEPPLARWPLPPSSTLSGSGSASASGSTSALAAATATTQSPETKQTILDWFLVAAGLTILWRGNKLGSGDNANAWDSSAGGTDASGVTASEDATGADLDSIIDGIVARIQPGVQSAVEESLGILAENYYDNLLARLDTVWDAAADRAAEGGIMEAVADTAENAVTKAADTESKAVAEGAEDAADALADTAEGIIGGGAIGLATLPPHAFQIQVSANGRPLVPVVTKDGSSTFMRSWCVYNPLLRFGSAAPDPFLPVGAWFDVVAVSPSTGLSVPITSTNALTDLMNNTDIQIVPVGMVGTSSARRALGMVKGGGLGWKLVKNGGAAVRLRYVTQRQSDFTQAALLSNTAANISLFTVGQASATPWMMVQAAGGTKPCLHVQTSLVQTGEGPLILAQSNKLQDGTPAVLIRARTSMPTVDILTAPSTGPSSAPQASVPMLMRSRSTALSTPPDAITMFVSKGFVTATDRIGMLYPTAKPLPFATSIRVVLPGGQPGMTMTLENLNKWLRSWAVLLLYTSSGARMLSIDAASHTFGAVDPPSGASTYAQLVAAAPPSSRFMLTHWHNAGTGGILATVTTDAGLVITPNEPSFMQFWGGSYFNGWQHGTQVNRWMVGAMGLQLYFTPTAT